MQGVDWRVMAHPRRRVMAEALAGYLGGVVVYDPSPEGEPSAWRTARVAWSRPTRRSHIGVIQDDCVPCGGFPSAARAWARDHPWSMIAFYLGSKHASAAGYLQDQKRGRDVHHLIHGHFVPTLCLVMPAAWAAEVAQREPDCPHDDEVIGRYRSERGHDALVPIPPLVDHSNAVPTVMWRDRPGYPTLRWAVGR